MRVNYSEPSFGDSPMINFEYEVHDFGEAIDLAITNFDSIDAGSQHDSLLLFCFSRALRNFEVCRNRALSADEAHSAMELLWDQAGDRFTTIEYFEDCLVEFEDVHSQVRQPLGISVIDYALYRAWKAALPKECALSDSPRVWRLTAVCYQLLRFHENQIFYLSVRDAAYICGISNPRSASSYLKKMEMLGILVCLRKGRFQGRDASTYRYCTERPNAESDQGSSGNYPPPE